MSPQPTTSLRGGRLPTPEAQDCSAAWAPVNRASGGNYGVRGRRCGCGWLLMAGAVHTAARASAGRRSHKASWRSCGARGRRWQAAAFWQAQYASNTTEYNPSQFTITYDIPTNHCSKLTTNASHVLCSPQAKKTRKHFSNGMIKGISCFCRENLFKTQSAERVSILHLLKHS